MHIPTQAIEHMMYVYAMRACKDTLHYAAYGGKPLTQNAWGRINALPSSATHAPLPRDKARSARGSTALQRVQESRSQESLIQVVP